jgi:hypothetical protein
MDVKTAMLGPITGIKCIFFPLLLVITLRGISGNFKGGNGTELRAPQAPAD